LSSSLIVICNEIKGAIVKLNRATIRKLIIDSLTGKPQRLNEAVEKVKELIPDNEALDDIISLGTKDKVNVMQQIIGTTSDGVWGDDTNDAWEKWLIDAVKEAYSEEQQGNMLAGVDKATSDWQGFSAESGGEYKANIDGVLKYMFDLANKQVDLKNKRELEQVDARQKLYGSINDGIDKLSDKELKTKFSDKSSKARSIEELKAIQKEVEAAVAKQNKTNQAKLVKANKLKGWDSSSPPGGSAGNLDIADYKITKESYSQSETAKNLDVGFNDILEVSIMPRSTATKAGIFMSIAPIGKSASYYTMFWKTKKLDFENLGVYLGTIDGGFDLEIPKGDPKKLSDLIDGTLKDKIIYKKGNRALSGLDVAWLAIKSYGNDKNISNGFKKYAGELAGAGDPRKVGARKESKKLNSKLLRRLILKTLKENGEL
jgi:hypothetical protein